MQGDKPRRPSDWHKTIHDLMQEMEDGKRKSIEGTEARWAREYEVSLIPAHYRRPKKGDVYESLADQKIDFMTSWYAPFTGGGEGQLYKGERIWISDETNPETPGTYAEVMDYSG